MSPRIADPAPAFRRPGDGTFRKHLTAEHAGREARGWHSIAAHLPVARLLDDRAGPGGGRVLVYEDVFSGRCTHLLADAVNRADTDPAAVAAVRHLVDAVADSWLHAADRTGRPAPIGACRPGLYADRLAPGSRLDSWYGAVPPVAVDDGARVHRLDLPGLIGRLRGELAADRRCATALTQGDATEPNIAAPLCWLDFEHAGRNTLAGEAAVLLWYLLAMGGWLVPAYKPRTYAATLTLHRPPLPPAVAHLRADGTRLEADATLRAGAGRRAALDTLLARLRGDLGAAIGGEAAAALRPWLAVRILGVLPLTALIAADRAVCLLKLAQLQAASLEEFAATAHPKDTP